MIAKSELIANTWYVGTSQYSLVAMWEADKQMFIFGYQWPGTAPQPMRLWHGEDTEIVGDGFTPTSILSPQLPTLWTLAQSIRASEFQRRLQDGQN